MKPPRPQYTSEGSFASGCLWFFLMSILIGWIPVIGHFLVGFIAGRKSGGVGTAILVVLSYAIIGAVIAAVLVTYYFGAEAGAISGGVVAIVLAAGLFIELLGAIVGAATIQRHPAVQAVQMYPPPPGQAQHGLYCAHCGTQIPDDSEFCHSCGAQIAGVEREKRRRAAEAGEAVPAPIAPAPQAAAPAPARPAARPAPRTVGAATLPQPYVGIAVIVGAALAAIGCLVPWVDVLGYTANGFDGGYVTSLGDGDGKDGLLILPIALVAALLGVLHFKERNSLASVGLIALGAAIVGIAGYNLWKIYDFADSMEYIGIGLYMTIVGGLVTALAGLLGPRVSPS